ncbi:MAG: hypothetical protein MZV49_18180 [Rhodopseudomonas palustris]|nr:hypothetical protein [Rhodopseudomonas palustris]
MIEELQQDIDKYPRLTAIAAFGLGLAVGIFAGRQRPIANLAHPSFSTSEPVMTGMTSSKLYFKVALLRRRVLLRQIIKRTIAGLAGGRGADRRRGAVDLCLIPGAAGAARRGGRSVGDRRRLSRHRSRAAALHAARAKLA